MKRQYAHLYKKLCGIGAVLVCFVLLLPFLRVLPVGAQPQTPTDTGRDHEFEAKIQNFFGALARSNSSPAFEELLRQSPLGSPAASTQLSELRNRVDELKAQFNEIVNWERYETKRIGEDVVLIQYILKYEQHPVIWTFTVYRKPSTAPGINNPWVLINIQFDTDFLSLL